MQGCTARAKFMISVAAEKSILGFNSIIWRLNALSDAQSLLLHTVSLVEVYLQVKRNSLHLLFMKSLVTGYYKAEIAEEWSASLKGQKEHSLSLYWLCDYKVLYSAFSFITFFPPFFLGIQVWSGLFTYDKSVFSTVPKNFFTQQEHTWSKVINLMRSIY